MNYIVKNPKIVKYGTEIIFFLSAKICDLIQQNIMNSSSLPYLKKGIRKWKPNQPCRLCKKFLQHVDFIQLNRGPLFSVFRLFEVHIPAYIHIRYYQIHNLFKSLF